MSLIMFYKYLYNRSLKQIIIKVLRVRRYNHGNNFRTDKNFQSRHFLKLVSISACVHWSRITITLKNKPIQGRKGSHVVSTWTRQICQLDSL